MEDTMILGFIVYLLAASLLFGFMPDSFFTGSTSTHTADLLTDDESGTPSLTDITYMGKVIRFMFIPMAIDGMPLFLSGLINIINILGIIMSVVWGYDKIRGNG